MAGLPALKGWDGLGMAIQAYGKRARPTIAWADALGAKTGRRIAARLVKGAYWDTEIKRTQEQGLADYPLFTRKAATDVSYLACAKDMLAAKHIYPAFATHNALTVATLLEWAGDARDFEFQRLPRGEGLKRGGPRAGIIQHLRAGRRASHRSHIGPEAAGDGAKPCSSARGRAADRRGFVADRWRRSPLGAARGIPDPAFETTVMPEGRTWGSTQHRRSCGVARRWAALEFRSGAVRAANGGPRARGGEIVEAQRRGARDSASSAADLPSGARDMLCGSRSRWRRRPSPRSADVREAVDFCRYTRRRAQEFAAVECPADASATS